MAAAQQTYAKKNAFFFWYNINLPNERKIEIIKTIICVPVRKFRFRHQKMKQIDFVQLFLE